MTDWNSNFPEQAGKIFVFGRYGLAPTFVFRNPELSVGAKSLYGYLSTFISGEQMKKNLFKAWPSRRRIQKDLNISGNTLSKYLQELKEMGLIKVKQSRQTLEQGRQVYGNNLYILQPYVKEPEESRGALAQDKASLEKINYSDSDYLNSCATPKVATSNTMVLHNTKTNSNTDLSINLAEESSPWPREERESHLTVADLITFWNKQGVIVHSRLGAKTKARIGKAWTEALEDYPEAELLQAMANYSKVYKEKKCDHKYSLVMFLEQGYEYFLHEENWNRRKSRAKIARSDFTYTEPNQDRSHFTSMSDG